MYVFMSLLLYLVFGIGAVSQTWSMEGISTDEAPLPIQESQYLNEESPMMETKRCGTSISVIYEKPETLVLAKSMTSSREPNCCGQCTDNGRAGCMVFVDGDSRCSVC